MRGRGQAHRLEIEVIADSAENDGENAAYEVTLDGLPLQRGEHRRIDGDPTAIDVYPLPDAIETAETAEILRIPEKTTMLTTLRSYASRFGA